MRQVSFDGAFGMAVGTDRTGAPLVLRSVDYGHQWQQFLPPAAADLPATGRWRPTDVVYRQHERSFMCGPGGRLFVPDAGTGTWQKFLLSSPDTTTPNLYSLFLTSSDRLYVSTSDGYILRLHPLRPQRQRLDGAE